MMPQSNHTFYVSRLHCLFLPHNKGNRNYYYEKYSTNVVIENNGSQFFAEGFW